LRRDVPSSAMAALAVSPLEFNNLAIFEKTITSDSLQKEAMRVVDSMRLEHLNEEISRLLQCGLASLDQHLVGPVKELEKNFQRGSHNSVYYNYKTLVGETLRQHLEKRLEAKKWFSSENDVKRVSAILVLAIASAIKDHPRKQAASSKKPQVRVCFLTPVHINT